jgi:hypothetical protein
MESGQKVRESEFGYTLSNGAIGQTKESSIIIELGLQA